MDESLIKPEDRIPRVTAATWKYESGAVGSLTHVVALQGTNYSCELEVFADGYSLKYVISFFEFFSWKVADNDVSFPFILFFHFRFSFNFYTFAMSMTLSYPRR